jgi:hypothetical protein
MSRVPIVAAWIALLISSAALAHGDHDTGSVQAHGEKSGGWWLDFVPRAMAGQRVEIDERLGFRFIKADGLPDHATGQFPNRNNPNRITAQVYAFRVPLQPIKAGTPTFYRPSHLFGVALNGVVFDPNTAEFWKNDPRSGWMIEALSGAVPLGFDRNNAHVQPDGSYHYHGVPVGLVEKLAAEKGAARDSLMQIGWAADGFPIYVDPTARSSWRIKLSREAGGPSGPPDGTYSLDYEFAASLGNLDQCNGRQGVTPEFPKGIYYYVVTTKFPFVPRCFTGVADPSFVKQGGPPAGGERPPGAGPGGPGGRRPPPPGGMPGMPPQR